MAPPHVPLSTTAPLQNQRMSNIYTASASPSETSPLPHAPSLPSPTLLLPRNAASTASAPAFPSSLSLCLPLSLPASRWLGDGAPGQRRRRPRRRPVPVPGHGAARRAPPVAVGLPTPAAASSVCSACAHMLQVLQEPYLPLLQETLAVGSAQVSSRSFILVW